MTCCERTSKPLLLMITWCCLCDVIQDEDHNRPSCTCGLCWGWGLENYQWWSGIFQFLILTRTPEWRVQLCMEFVVSHPHFHFAMWLTETDWFAQTQIAWIQVDSTEDVQVNEGTKWTFPSSSAKLVSEGNIPSPVVLACAFLAWQSLETMAKKEQSRHSSAVT